MTDHKITYVTEGSPPNLTRKLECKCGWVYGPATDTDQWLAAAGRHLEQP